MSKHQFGILPSDGAAAHTVPDDILELEAGQVKTQPSVQAGARRPFSPSS